MSTAVRRATVSLTEEEHRRLRRLAVRKNTSMSKLLRAATVEFLEDEEDIREGLKALSDEGGTLTWEEYKRRRERLA